MGRSRAWMPGDAIVCTTPVRNAATAGTCRGPRKLCRKGGARALSRAILSLPIGSACSRPVAQKRLRSAGESPDAEFRPCRCGSPEIFASSADRPPASAEWLDAVGHRISDVFLGNHPDDFRRPPAPLSADNHGHARMVARHALHHVEHNVALAREREIALGDDAEMDTAISLLDAAAQPEIDAHDAGDVIASRHHHMLETGAARMLPQEGVE